MTLAQAWPNQRAGGEKVFAVERMKASIPAIMISVTYVATKLVSKTCMQAFTLGIFMVPLTNQWEENPNIIIINEGIKYKEQIKKVGSLAVTT